MSISTSPAKPLVGLEVCVPARSERPTTPNPAPPATDAQPWRVAAVIPCFNRPADLGVLLQDLARQRLKGIRLWCVVVDNCSAAPLSSVPAPPGLDVEFLRMEENIGGSGGFNAGTARVLAGEGLTGRLGPADFIWWLDSDARVARSCLYHLVRVLAKRDDLGAVGSALCDTATGRVWECGGGINRANGYVFPARCGDVDKRFLAPADYLAACSALVRPEAIRKTGLFPEVFIYYDDVDWCIQMTAKTGLKVRGVPRSRAFHPPGDRRYATWGRYYIARNGFSHMATMGMGAWLRFRRAQMEIKRAIAQTMMGLDELAELHLRGLEDAADGNFRRIEPRALMNGFGFKPYKELAQAVAQAVSEAGPGATLYVHPILKSTIAGLESFRRELPKLRVKWAKDRRVWRHRGLGDFMRRDAWDALKRAVLGPDADAAIVPTGWPTAWFRAPVLIQITSEGFLVRRVRPLAAIRKAIGVWARGQRAAIRIARRGPGVRPCPPAPAPVPAGARAAACSR